MMGVLCDIDGVLRRLGGEIEFDLCSVMSLLAECVIDFISTHHEVFITKFENPEDGRKSYFTRFESADGPLFHKKLYFFNEEVQDVPWGDLCSIVTSRVKDILTKDVDGGKGIDFFRKGVESPFASIIFSRDGRNLGFYLELFAINGN